MNIKNCLVMVMLFFVTTDFCFASNFTAPKARRVEAGMISPGRDVREGDKTIRSLLEDQVRTRFGKSWSVTCSKVFLQNIDALPRATFGYMIAWNGKDYELLELWLVDSVAEMEASMVARDGIGYAVEIREALPFVEPEQLVIKPAVPTETAIAPSAPDIVLATSPVAVPPPLEIQIPEFPVVVVEEPVQGSAQQAVVPTVPGLEQVSITTTVAKETAPRLENSKSDLISEAILWCFLFLLGSAFILWQVHKWSQPTVIVLTPAYIRAFARKHPPPGTAPWTKKRKRAA